jgi:hypothetical protein
MAVIETKTYNRAAKNGESTSPSRPSPNTNFTEQARA